ncbi:MAG: uroporphyrinogen-III synthase [Thalassotalea sp.]|nr:uroporphyrinogen-III synthase [Thalassotalea sp.]
MLTTLKVAITRPQQQGLQLQQALDKVGISSMCQPLFSYRLNTDKNKIMGQVESLQPTIVIFISTAAVEFANEALPLKEWLDENQQIIAVGEKTLQALATLDIQATCPEIHNSEGMLALPQLSSSLLMRTTKNILIVRGESGREFLAEQLSLRGAQVEYLESYQREWLTLSHEQTALWHPKNINTIVITSNDLLQRVVDLIDITDNYWQNTCLWLVVSERIAQSAQKMGLKNVVNSCGANNQSIITTLLNMES